MQTYGKISRFTRRSLATDAVSELARSILHPALWWHKKKLKRACGGTQTIGMCCACATSCGELSSRIAPAVHYPERDAPLQHRPSGNSSPAMIEAYSMFCQCFVAEGLPATCFGFGHGRPIARVFVCAAPARARRSSRIRFASAPDTAHTVKGCCIDKNLFNSSYLEGKELSVRVKQRDAPVATSLQKHVSAQFTIFRVLPQSHRWRMLDSMV